MKALSWISSLLLLVLLLVPLSSVSAQTPTAVYDCDTNSYEGWIQSAIDANALTSDMQTQNWTFFLGRVQSHYSGTQVTLWAVPPGWDIVYTRTSSLPQLNVRTTTSAVTGTARKIQFSSNMTYATFQTLTLNAISTNNGITVGGNIHCMDAGEGDYYESPENYAGITTTQYWTFNKPDDLFPYSPSTAVTGMQFEDAPEPTGGFTIEEPLDVNLFSATMAEPLEVSGAGGSSGGLTIEELRAFAHEYLLEGSALLLATAIGFAFVRQFRFRVGI